MRPPLGRFGVFLPALILAAVGAAAARADEGMWLFNRPPRAILQERYGFQPDDDWLLHLQRSSVRFNAGGSGSFVSGRGLVMTNHHVGAGTLQKLSTADRDYLSTGFHARSTKEELRCPDLELNVLMDIEDVTERIGAAVKPGMSAAEAEKARRAAMNTIEKESLDATGLRSDVVTLYHGARYHLYRYKKYTDVRLVFAPESAIAALGGDPDNFDYPRFCLDVCFFRVYEEGRPVRVTHFLKWSPNGPADGELVFVSGHPGRTERLRTLEHLRFYRDRLYPFAQARTMRREVILSTYSECSLESARRARRPLHGTQNSRKRIIGMLAGLQDPALIDRKAGEEKALRQAVGDQKPWDEVARSLDLWKRHFVRHDLLEGGRALSSRMFGIARTLVRLAEETPKPNAERLREYRDSNLESLRFQLFSPAPIYPDLESVELADSLGLFMELAGADDPLVVRVMAGKSPQQRAAELVAGCGLADVAARRKLAEGGRKAIEASQDPMIRLALLVDTAARQVRKIEEEQVAEPQRQAYAEIARAQFAALGDRVYPDATFTLRLAFGAVRGYEQSGEQIAPWTTLGGAFEHAAAHGNREPFQMPSRWIDRKERLDLKTPFNFVCTTDITGGNSGSPVVNRRGELVGIVFDGNRHAFVWDFAFTDTRARCVSVHSAGIVESLRKVYEAKELVEELGR